MFGSLSLSLFFLLCLGFVVSSVCLSRVCYIGRGGEREGEREGKRENKRENFTSFFNLLFLLIYIVWLSLSLLFCYV